MNNICLGTDKYGKRVFISPKSINPHIAVFGATGSGKSTLLDAIVLQLIAIFTGIHVLRFAWHSCTQNDQRIPGIATELAKCSFTIKADEELPMKLFDEGHRKTLSRREQNIEIDRITEIISSAAKLPMTQRAALMAAVGNVYDSEDNLYMCEGLRAVGDNLLLLGVTARNAYTKLHSVFEGANITYGDIEFNKPVCELDMNKFSNVAQKVISNLTMQYYYDLAKRDKFIKTGFAMIIDEAQNADLREGQIMSELLQEARKKNLRMILATPQPLNDSRNFDAMLQCGTRIFFKPAGHEDKLSKLIDPRHELDMTLMLKQLKRGDFVAVGQFVTEDGVQINHPLKLKTLIPDPVESQKKNNSKLVATLMHENK